MGVTSIGGHTRPDCNARYDVNKIGSNVTFRVSYMTGEYWETFRDGLTCSTNPHEILDADWSRVN